MDAVDHYAALPSASPFILLAAGLVVVFVLAVLARLALLFHHRRMSLADFRRLDELNRTGWAGWGLKASSDSTTVMLTCRCEAPVGVSILFDTDGQAELPPDLEPVATGVRQLDLVFPVRGGTPGVQDCLQANRPLLERLTPALRGWRGRLISLAIRGRSVEIVLRQGARPSSRQRLVFAELQAALPQLAWLAAALLSAAWWRPPATPVASAGNVYRGRGGVALDAPVWRLEDPFAPSAASEEGQAEPVSLLQIVERLQGGTLSWLWRIRRDDQSAFEPIAACAELQDLLIPANESRAGGASRSPRGKVRRLGWWLFQLAQRGVIVLPWLLLALVSMETSRCHFDATMGDASLTWPHTSGRVTQSSIKSREMDEGGHKHRPIVIYEYAVAGRSYRSDRVRFAYHWSFEGYYPDLTDAEAVTARYPIGRAVPVYYDPEAPERSTLETGALRIEWIKAGVGLGLMALFGALLGWAGLCRLVARLERRRARRQLAKDAQG